MSNKIEIGEKILRHNDLLAIEIRRRLAESGVLALNLVSSPGSGKTSLLENTLATLGDRVNAAVIAGDVQTENDAVRLIRSGGKIIRPLVTGGACHLDAGMISSVVAELDLDMIDVLFIENVGNLVCPAAYDLGEDKKVAIISTTEGDDKPLKYPTIFRRSSILVVNKTDLLGLSDFDLERVKINALNINPELKIFEISCRIGEGLDLWYDWLIRSIVTKKENAAIKSG